MISKKYTFVNVGNQASFLGNIRTVVDAANAGAEYGWTIDRYNSGDDGELLLHSTGVHGNQNLYYSIKLRNPSSGCSHIHMCGQTGYDVGSNYDAQPGRYTEESNGLVGSWNGISSNSYQGCFLRSPVAKQVIFVNKQFIAVFWTTDITRYYWVDTFPTWQRIFIGAIDSFFPETEQYLNWMDQTIWSDRGWYSNPFLGSYAYYPHIPWGWQTVPRPSHGFLYKQPFDSVAVNKNKFMSGLSASLISSPRLYSTIYYRDCANLSIYGSAHYWSGWDYNGWRLGFSYQGGTRYNVSVLKHYMHRPVMILYESLSAEEVYQYPIGYLPYNAIRMNNILKGDDTVSYGTKNFTVFPALRDGNDFGMAFEYIQG